MRGNPRNQAGQIFRALDCIGNSRHAAKKDARVAGYTGSHSVAQQTGIYSYATMTKYRTIATEFLQYCRNVHNVRNAKNISPEHIEGWLRLKMSSGIRYKTFATYAAALGKMNVGINTIYGRNDDWSADIDKVRSTAKLSLEKDVRSRGYLYPDRVTSKLNGIYRVAAELQLYGGARVKEISLLTEKNLLGNGIIKLTNTKGGRQRNMQVTPALYEQVANVISLQGEFRFQYRTYLRHLKEAAFESCQPYTGSHGLRWNFAQQTSRRIQESGKKYEEALQEVSYKMGHSRKKITEHYLK